MIDLLNPKTSQNYSGPPEETLGEKPPFPTKAGWSLRWGSRNQKILATLISTMLALFLLLYLFIVRPTSVVYTKAVGLKEPFDQLRVALEGKDSLLVSRALGQLESALLELKGSYQRLGYLRGVPFVRDYYLDGEHLLEAFSLSLEGGRSILEAVGPFAGVLGEAAALGKNLSTEEKVSDLTKTLPQLSPQIDAFLGKVFLIKMELDQIDPQRYPRELGDMQLRSWLESGQNLLSQIEPLLEESKGVAEFLPNVLGIPERNYLVIFQNDSELRATGGFITGYMIVTVRGGKVVNEEFHSGAHIARRLPHSPPPKPIRRYLGVRTWHFHDGNFSPDFKKTAENLISMWKRTKLPQLSGLIAINTKTGEKLIDLFGPVKLSKYSLDLSDRHWLPKDCRVGGDKFTSTNLVCRLEFYVERRGRGGAEKRKVILAQLAGAIISRVKSSLVVTWPRLSDFFFSLRDEKDLLLYSVDKEEQALIEKLGFAGRVEESEGDYLHINDSNFGGKKTDIFMRESVEQRLTKLESGGWRKTVKIVYHNPQEYDDWLSVEYKDFVRLYVPQGSKLIAIKGAKKEWGSWEELGKTVFGAYFTLWPKRRHSLTFIYDLPEGIIEKDYYRLMMQKQPGTNITLVKVKIDGKIESFNLKTDKKFEIALE